MANPVVAAGYAATYSRAELEEIRRAALEAHRESTTVSRSFEGSSLSISRENAVQVLEDVAAALDILDAQEAGADPDLARRALGVGLDFSHRRIE